jgi:hypothetical protein
LGAGLIPHKVPQILINKEYLVHVAPHIDVILLGDCDIIVQELCKKASWELLKGDGSLTADLNSTFKFCPPNIFLFEGATCNGVEIDISSFNGTEEDLKKISKKNHGKRKALSEDQTAVHPSSNHSDDKRPKLLESDLSIEESTSEEDSGKSRGKEGEIVLSPIHSDTSEVPPLETLSPEEEEEFLQLVKEGKLSPKDIESEIFDSDILES